MEATTKRQITVKTASELYEISRWTLYRLVENGLIPHRRLGRRIYLPVDKLEGWLRERDIEPKKGVSRNE